MAIATGTEDEYWRKFSTIGTKLQENEALTRDICYLIQDSIGKEWITNGILFDIVEEMKQANLISLNETSLLTKCLSYFNQKQLIDEINALMSPILEDDEDNDECFDLKVYPMKNDRKCVIFTIENDESFNESAEKLEKWFKYFGFVVEHYPCRPPKSSQIKWEDIYNKLGKERMNVNYDCLIIIFLCYTEQGKITFTEFTDKNIDIADIRNMFQENNCGHLKGKAKIFFVFSISSDNYGLSLTANMDEAFCFISMPPGCCGNKGGVSKIVQLLDETLNRIVKNKKIEKTFDEFSMLFGKRLKKYAEDNETPLNNQSQINLFQDYRFTKLFKFY